MGMKNAAFGVRMHSGWGVVVCISGNSATPEIVDRRRIVIIEPTMAGAKQPYHFVESLGLEDAERDDSDLHRVAETEKEYQRGDQRRLRDWSNQFDQGFEQMINVTRIAHRDA